MKKSTLSFLLAMLFALTVLPSAVWADEGKYWNPGETYYDEYGQETTGDWAVITEKFVTPTARDNEYQVTLKITAKPGYSVTVPDQQAVSADIVMVIDLSGSMDEDGRWDAMKNAARSFIENLDNPNARIAVAVYSGPLSTGVSTATQYDGWLEIGGHSWFDADSRAALLSLFQDSAAAMRASVANMTNKGTGTNGQAGYLAAYELLRNSTGELKYLIYMSDGETNTRYADLTCTTTSWWHSHSGSCYGTVYDGRHRYTVADTSAAGTLAATIAAVEQLGYLREGIEGLSKVYTVGLEMPDAVRKPDAANACGYNMDGKGYFSALENRYVDSYSTGTIENIQAIYQEIGQDILRETRPGCVVDPMSRYVTLDRDSIAGYDAVTADGDGVLYWDIAGHPDAHRSIDGDGNTVYQLHYRITLDITHAEDWGRNPDGSYKLNPANGETLLTFQRTEDGAVRESHTVAFRVPKVGADLPGAPEPEVSPSPEPEITETPEPTPETSPEPEVTETPEPTPETSPEPEVTPAPGEGEEFEPEDPPLGGIEETPGGEESEDADPPTAELPFTGGRSPMDAALPGLMLVALGAVLGMRRRDCVLHKNAE